MVTVYVCTVYVSNLSSCTCLLRKRDHIVSNSFVCYVGMFILFNSVLWKGVGQVRYYMKSYRRTKNPLYVWEPFLTEPDVSGPSEITIYQVAPYTSSGDLHGCIVLTVSRDCCIHNKVYTGNS